MNRNEEKKGDEGVVGRSKERADTGETMPVLAELVSSDLLHFASQWLMAFASLPERPAIIDRVSTRCIVPGQKYGEILGICAGVVVKLSSTSTR